jgi:hypothetical protein
MRIIHWLFIVSVALFISGVGFVIAGARSSRQAAPVEVEAAPAIKPVATVRQIMIGIVAPSAKIVFDSVGTIVSAAGVEERKPQNDEEWAVVGSSAAALVESANLMVMGGRAVDKGDWVKMSQALADAGMMAVKAADAKDTDGILTAGSIINTSCDDCHQRYQRQ